MEDIIAMYKGGGDLLADARPLLKQLARLRIVRSMWLSFSEISSWASVSPRKI